LHKAMLELSMRLALEATKESEWHRRMTNKKLNQTGRKIAVDLLKLKSDVYFYKPPTQQETERLGRRAKHCQHYHGPAKVVKKLGHHSYAIEYKGRTFQRDQGMLIPASHLVNQGKDDVYRFNDLPPSMHTPDNQPREGELVLTKDAEDSNDWYCARIEEVLPDRITVSYYTTSTAPDPDYATSTQKQREQRLSKVRFQRTWVNRSDKLPTTVAPPLNRQYKWLYKGRIPKAELDGHLLVRNIAITSSGRLTSPSLELAAALQLPHHLGAGGPDDYVSNHK
jgi:hypothetical protein